MKKKVRYCIIGGGATGIGIGKNLSQLGIDYDLYERESDFGGTWNFGKPCGLVYESTHLISSRRITQFNDFPMPESYPVYPNHRQYLAYLRSLASTFGVYKKAFFNRSVEHLTPLGSDGERWSVTDQNGQEAVYDAVIIANGQYQRANIPVYPGTFSGTTMHSIDYRTNSELSGKRVLVVGSGNSGCDIAVDAVSLAGKVLHSTRRGYHYFPKFIDGQPTPDWMMDNASRYGGASEFWRAFSSIIKISGYRGEDYGLPSPDHEIDQAHPIMNSQILYHIGHGDITPKPDIKLFSDSEVVFEDGSHETVDLVIYCTGYKTSFPFLSSEVLEWENTAQGGREYLSLAGLHRHYDNLIFAGFYNTVGGFGNFINVLGQFLGLYLQNREEKTVAYQVIREWVLTGQINYLFQANFIDSDRHAYELDMWKTIQVFNFINNKLKKVIQQSR